MLDRLCIKPLIEKTRYDVSAGGKEWVVDEFLGENAGLIVAEIELHEESEQFDKPAWAGAEVTTDPRYTNRNLVSNPYRRWRGAF
jgi:adenylate cyclase